MRIQSTRYSLRSASDTWQRVAKVRQPVARRTESWSFALRCQSIENRCDDHACTHQPISNISSWCTPSASTTEANKDSMAPRMSPLMSSSCSFSNDLTKAPRIVSRRLLSALPATLTNAPNARALNAVIGWTMRVGMRTGKTLLARTYDISCTPLAEIDRSTHTHDLLQGLQSRLACFSWLPHSLQQRRNGLVDRLGTHVVLSGVEGLCGSSSDGCLLVHESLANGRDDGVFVVFQHIAVGGCHDVGESQTSTFP